jgi:hypothetical protein
VLGYLGARVIEQACRRLPVSRDWVGPGGKITDTGFRAELADAAAALARAAGATTG